MKRLIALILTLSFVQVLSAQQLERNPEYDRLLIWTVDGSGNPAYYRVEHLPVRVCQDGDYGAEWNTTIQAVIIEMASVVPSVYATTANCDIHIIVFDTMPSNLCWRDNGTQATACAVYVGRFLYPVNIYIERHVYRVPVLLHEAMHAYGVWVHPERSDSVVSANPDVNWFLVNTTLTEFDRTLLGYLYDQPSFAYEDQAVMVTLAEAYERRWCDSVEDMFRQHRINWTQYEKYRCP